MPTGGKLTIRTSYSDVGPYDTGEEQGSWVVIAVSDTGLGMSEETQKRMFDPFFTTKDEGAGTGLGLATVWAIVSKSDGHIDVQSELGAGTTITIYLPATDKRLGAPRRGSPALLRPDPARPSCSPTTMRLCGTSLLGSWTGWATPC